jgi:hypothetical protein
MQFAVMEPADGDRVFVADLAPQRARLGEPKVMGFRRRPAADDAGLRSDVVAGAPCRAGESPSRARGGVLRSAWKQRVNSTGKRNGSFAVKATLPVVASKR